MRINISVFVIISESVCRGGVYPRPPDRLSITGGDKPRPYDHGATIPDNSGVLRRFRSRFPRLEEADREWGDCNERRWHRTLTPGKALHALPPMGAVLLGSLSDVCLENYRLK